MVAKQAISIGDTVSFLYGTTELKGVVVEDSGPIGVNKRHIYRIHVPNDPYEDQVVHMPEDEVTLADPQVDPISNSEVIDYLKGSGLLRVLHSRLSEGRNQPRVWLTRDSLNNVVHTFVADRGVVGGGTIPFPVLYDYRIQQEKVDEVRSFLMSFDLSDDDAQQIIDSVGISPQTLVD